VTGAHPLRRGFAHAFLPREGVTRAVDGLSLSIGAGETLGLVGESGCGKSVTALSVMRLLPPVLGRTVAGPCISAATTC